MIEIYPAAFFTYCSTLLCILFSLLVSLVLVLVQISSSTAFPYEQQLQLPSGHMTFADVPPGVLEAEVDDMISKRSTGPKEDVTIHDRRHLAHLEHCSVVCRFCRMGLPRRVSARCNLDCLDNGRLYQACFVFWNSSSGVIKDRK